MKKLLLVAVILVLGATAFAQTNPASATTTLTLTKQASLSIAVTTPPGALTLAASAPDTSVTSMVVNSTWNLGAARLSKSVEVCATVAALAGTGGGNIDTVPTSAIYVDSIATPAQTVASGAACGNSSVLIATHALSSNAALHNNGGIADTAYIQIKGLPDLTPDTYTGTVTVYAYVTP